MSRLINISLTCGLSLLMMACGGGTPASMPTNPPTSTPNVFAPYFGDWVQCAAIPGNIVGIQGAGSAALFGLQRRLTLKSSGLNAKEERAARIFQNADCTGALVEGNGNGIPLPNKYRGVLSIAIYQASQPIALQSVVANRAYLFDEAGESLQMKMLVYLEAQKLKLIPLSLYENWDQNTYDPARIETYAPFP